MRLIVSCIPGDRGKSGISAYERAVVRELRRQGHELLLLEDEQHPILAKKPILSMLWYLFVLPVWLWQRRKEYDGFVICAANRRACAWYPLPTTATVHDLANFHIPKKYSRLRMLYLAHVLPFYAKRAQRLVAISESTKADMVRYWGVAPEDVTVLYNGADKPEGANGPKGERGSSILYISRIEHPGKNHVRLIEAYSRLSPEVAAAHPLVLAGADWKDAQAVHDAAASSPNAAHIRFTGFVDDEKLEQLWREAYCYVFPSLFEGFGLSLVEAMWRGIPCACSSNGSLGEVAGDAAITFDPNDVEAIASALEKLVTMPEAEREALVARGTKRAQAFSWERHAKGIVSLINEARTSSRLFGIRVAKASEREAVEHITALAKRGCVGGRAAFVATLNVDFVANAVPSRLFVGNEELWGFLKGADYVTADGMPIVLLSRILGNPLPARVTGADMVPAICKRFAEEGLSIYVLGCEREALEEAFRRLAPVRIAGLDPAMVSLEGDSADIIERINAAKPDLLFVALGNPKQELWMGRNAARLNVPVMIGVGGTFNFIAGRVKRAPKWMQRTGLEWIYRISQEPGRLWKRYAYGLVKFSCLALGSLLKGRRA